MTHEHFKNLLEELDDSGAKTLAEKNARYSSPDDALQNFHEGAEIMGCTTAQACWGYMTKHLSALRKMIWSNDFSNREDVYEKCIDIINYIRFLWAISEEERNKVTKDNDANEEETSTEASTDCCNCIYVDVIEYDDPCKSCRGTKIYATPEYYDAPNNFKKA